MLTKKEKQLRKKLRFQKTKTFQKLSWKKWHKKAWSVQSLYIRKSSALWNGAVECYTCFNFIPYQEAQLGHFHHNKADFERENLRIQCAQCNLYKSGNLAVYATRLVQDIGYEAMVDLSKTANTKIYTLEELKDIHKKYSDLLNNL